MHIIRNAINQIRRCNNDRFPSGFLCSNSCLVKQHFSLQKGCVTTRFLATPQFKRLRDISCVVIVSFTGKLCALFTP